MIKLYVLVLIFAGYIFVVNGCDPFLSSRLEVICIGPDFKILQCNKNLPDNTIAHVKCKEDSAVEGKKLTCVNGRWDGTFSEQNCKRVSGNCGPLVSPNLEVICVGPDFKVVPCTERSPSGTIAHFLCKDKSLQIPADYNKLTCVNGAWDKPLTEKFCKPVCGKAVPVDNIEQFIVHGTKVKFGNFPWHAGIYKKSASDSDEWDLQCGGSLVSPKIVLSAAHCFKVEKYGERVLIEENIRIMRVGVGKRFITIGDERDKPQARDFELEQVIVHPQWEGSFEDYRYDISIIKLRGSVTFSNLVHPICLDFGPNSLENRQLVPGNVGVVPGWGITEKKEVSDELLVAEMPYVDRDKCKKESSIKLFKYVKPDKICGGDRVTRQTVCKGDSGGGYVFQDPKTETYYLRGIVSLGVAGCKGNDYALFTKVSEYSQLIYQYIKN